MVFGLPVYAQKEISPPKRALVMVPGILGSALSDKNGKIIWGDLDSLNHFSRLQVSNGPADPQDDLKPDGLIQSVQILGPWKVKVYHDLRKTFEEEMGYTFGKDYFEFSYDWRQSNFTSAADLRKWIDQNLGTRPFDIIAHSMGGLVSEIFIKRLDTQRQVKRFVTMGTPFHGSVNTMLTLHEGWGMVANWMIGGLEQIRLTTLSFPSTYELLPSYSNCCNLLTPGTSPITYNPMTEKGWHHVEWDVPEYATDAAKKRTKIVLTHARELAKLVNEPMPNHLQVNRIAGEKIDTKMRFYVDPTKRKITKFRHGDGDGTVIVRSAAKEGKVEQADVSFSKHVVIFDDDATVARLKRIFRSDLYDKPYDYASKSFNFVTTDGRLIPMRTMGLDIVPSIMAGGKPFSIQVRLSTLKPKLPIELVPVEVMMYLKGSSKATPIPLDKPVLTDSSNSRRVVYTGQAMAPTVPTTVRIELKAQGIAQPVVDYLLVPSLPTSE